MTTEQQITTQLNDDYDKFQNGIYDGKVEVPENMIELFKVGILALPPSAHKINFIKVKVISAMKEKELTNALISDVIKVILNTPLEKLFGGDYDRIIDRYINFEKFVIAYNKHVDEFRKKLEMRRATLNSLSVQNRSPLHIIN